MKGTLFLAIYLNSLFSFSQTQSESITNIARFIESTIQIPFKAKVDNINGIVKVSIMLDENSLRIKYEISKTLRKDCDNEAIRVLKLINLRNLNNAFPNKKKITFEINFSNENIINYYENYVFELFDKKNKKVFDKKDANLMRRFLVDTLTGFPLGNVEYFKIRKEKYEPIGYYKLKIDNIGKHQLEILENTSDSLIEFNYSQEGFYGLQPNFFGRRFSNGQVAYDFHTGKTFEYFPNGRINKVTEKDNNFNEKITKWYANGQLAYEKETYLDSKKIVEKYLIAYDTLGNITLSDGNGLLEYFEGLNLSNKGKIKNGKKEGIWEGKNIITQNILYSENYENGICIKGTSFTDKGNIDYTEPEVNAQFLGGNSELGNFLNKNLIYPINAQKDRLSGKVLTTFYVCTDGSLCDFAVLLGVSPELDEEALRVIKLQNGKWKPGLKRGIPVKSKFNLPIMFQLF